MLVMFNPAQRIVLGISLFVLVVGLLIGYRIGSKPDDDVGEQVTYTLSDAGSVPITVHVVGAVQRPGIYTLAAGSRVRDAILTAGGFSANADTQSVNLAAFVDDGQQVRVEAKPASQPEPEPQPAPAPSTVASSAPNSSPPPQPSTQPVAPAPSFTGSRTPTQAVTSQPRRDLPEFARGQRQAPVRLNHAGLEELQRIPGVGPELAKNILYHRSMRGGFKSFGELDEVPGIGPATIEKIRVSATLN